MGFPGGGGARAFIFFLENDNTETLDEGLMLGSRWFILKSIHGSLQKRLESYGDLSKQYVSSLQY